MNSDEAISKDCPIKILLNVETLKDIKNTQWLRRFSNMELLHRQPWYDRVIVWFEENREKHAAFFNVKSEQRERIFNILAAGFWFQNKPIEFCDMIAVRTEDPDGTGAIWVDDKNQVIFEEKLSIEC